MCEKNGRARAFARSLPASECGGPRHGGQQEDRLSACRADCRRTGLAGPMGIGRLIVVVGVVDAPAASGMNASVLVAPAAPSSASVTSDIVASSAPALSAVRAAAACAAAISSANASSAFSFAAFFFLCCDHHDTTCDQKEPSRDASVSRVRASARRDRHQPGARRT
eukprot:7382097-Prymnesium_polylepis.2